LVHSPPDGGKQWLGLVSAVIASSVPRGWRSGGRVVFVSDRGPFGSPIYVVFWRGVLMDPGLLTFEVSMRENFSESPARRLCFSLLAMGKFSGHMIENFLFE